MHTHKSTRYLTTDRAKSWVATDTWGLGMGSKFASGFALTAFVMTAGLVEAQDFETGPYPNEQAYITERFDNTTYVRPSKSIGLVRAVELSVSDQVADKCWTNHEAVKARLRVELERSNIAVYGEPLATPTAFTPVVELTVVGYRIGSGPCIGTATASVSYRSDVQLGSLGYTGGVISVGGLHTIWSKTSILSKGGNLDEPMMQQSQEWVDTLIADISEARRDADVQKASRIWPSRSPLTQREFNAQIEKATSQAQ